MSIISMTDVNKGYMLGEEKIPILKNIYFSVEPGEYVAILGPSGSGKTTLMNIVGCMDVLDSGEYYLDGMPIHTTKQDDLTEVRNRKIGFIFQNYQLIPTYNVMQNIIMPLIMRGMSAKEAEEKAEEAAEEKEYITIEASSVDELITKLQDYSYSASSAKVMTEAERAVGSRFDFRG